MDPLFYIVAIMGCGDGGGACRQARVEPVHYTSIGACQAAMAGAIARNADIDYPVVTAACRATGQKLVQAERDPGRRG